MKYPAITLDEYIVQAAMVLVALGWVFWSAHWIVLTSIAIMVFPSGLNADISSPLFREEVLFWLAALLPLICAISATILLFHYCLVFFLRCRATYCCQCEINHNSIMKRVPVAYCNLAPKEPQAFFQRKRGTPVSFFTNPASGYIVGTISLRALVGIQ